MRAIQPTAAKDYGFKEENDESEATRHHGQPFDIVRQGCFVVSQQSDDPYSSDPFAFDVTSFRIWHFILK